MSVFAHLRMAGGGNGSHGAIHRQRPEQEGKGNEYRKEPGQDHT